MDSEVTASRWSTNRVLAFIVLPAVLLANLLCALGPAPVEAPTAVGYLSETVLKPGVGVVASAASTALFCVS